MTADLWERVVIQGICICVLIWTKQKDYDDDQDDGLRI